MTGTGFIERVQIHALRIPTPQLSVMTGFDVYRIEDFKKGAAPTASEFLVFMDALGYKIIDYNDNRVNYVYCGPDFS